MESKEFIYKRICIFACRDFDPTIDEEVEDILRTKFNIFLPQRKSLDESLESSTSDHEIIQLLLKYRALC